MPNQRKRAPPDSAGARRRRDAVREQAAGRGPEDGMIKFAIARKERKELGI
jgi:hypothetical protein